MPLSLPTPGACLLLPHSAPAADPVATVTDRDDSGTRVKRFSGRRGTGA
jgi:hypothetical protein